jgi:hypothetical protein
MAEGNWFQRFWDFLGHYGNLQTLLGLFASFGVSSYVISVLPGGWHPPQYWAVLGTAFFGTLFTLKLATLSISWMIRRWFRPSRLELTADSGNNACVGIRHYGSPTTLTAQGRVVALLDGSVNHSPHRFDCLLSKGGNRELSRTLTNRDWAHIVLASEDFEEHSGYPDDYDHTGLRIHRGTTGIAVPDAGAQIELEILASPPLQGGVTHLVKRFNVLWANGHAQIEEVTV